MSNRTQKYEVVLVMDQDWWKRFNTWLEATDQEMDMASVCYVTSIERIDN